MKAVADELTTLRAAFREIIEGYASRVEEDIAKVQSTIEGEIGNEKISGAKLRDLRDMLTLLRRTPIKAGKARRKDLKKVDTLVEDLQMLVEGWK